MCRKSDTAVATAMALVNSWTSATDGTCKTIPAGSCKCANKTQVVSAPVAVATDITCKDEFACFTSAALPAGHCRKTAGSSYAWTSKTDTTCVALTAGQCRCKEDNTAQTGTGSGLCTNACTYASDTAASGESTGEGEGEGGEGGASGTTAGSNGVIFALFAMILSMF